MPTHITHSPQETRTLARSFSKTLCCGDIILLEGNLGAGKTTFIQGVLEDLGAEKPYTSPTFVIVKTYELKTMNHPEKTNCLPATLHHIDTYRISSNDLLNLGWEEMTQEKNSVILIEWPERVRDILPKTTKTIYFSHKDGDLREIIIPD